MTREELRRVIERYGLRRGSVRLRSGQTSEVYFDCREALLRPGALEAAGELLWREIRPYGVEAIGGLALGAVPLATAAAMRAWREGQPVFLFMVRPAPKEHGLGRRIEGPVRSGQAVALVEDVVTTGQSVLEALEALGAEGLKVRVVAVVVDRQEGGARRIESRGIPLRCLFRKEEFFVHPQPS